MTDHENAEPAIQPLAIPSPDQVGVLALFLGQMGEMERRISKKIDENAEAAKHRWLAHDDSHDKLARAINDIDDRLTKHLLVEEQEKLVFQARVGPIKSAITMAVRDWRTVVIIGFLLIDFLGQVGQAIGAFK